MKIKSVRKIRKVISFICKKPIFDCESLMFIHGCDCGVDVNHETVF